MKKTFMRFVVVMASGLNIFLGNAVAAPGQFGAAQFPPRCYCGLSVRPADLSLQKAYERVVAKRRQGDRLPYFPQPEFRAYFLRAA